MKPNRKELVIKNLEIDTFNDILMKIFFRERSPNYPICVDVDYISVFNEDNGKTYYGEEDSETFRVSEAPTDFFVDDWRVLARIHQFKISSQLGVIILGEEELIEDWDKVMSITENIISKIKQFGGEIVSTDPIESIHVKLPPEEDKSKKKPSKIESKNLTLSANGKNNTAEFKKLKENTKEEFRKRYALIKEYRQVINQEYNDGVYKECPKISVQDLIDYLHNKTGEIVSSQTLYRTNQYGKLGLLD